MIIEVIIALAFGTGIISFIAYKHYHQFQSVPQQKTNKNGLKDVGYYPTHTVSKSPEAYELNPYSTPSNKKIEFDIDPKINNYLIAIEKYVFTIRSLQFNTNQDFYWSSAEGGNAFKLKLVVNIKFDLKIIDETIGCLHDTANPIKSYLKSVLSFLKNQLKAYIELLAEIEEMINHPDKHKDQLLNVDYATSLNGFSEKAQTLLVLAKKTLAKKVVPTEETEDIRVLILTIGAFVPSGVVGVTKQLINGLPNKGVKIKVISHWTGLYPYEIWEPPQNYAEGSHKNDLSLFRTLTFDKVLGIVQQFRPTIIHVHSWSWADHVNGGISKIMEITGNPSLIFTIHSPRKIRYNPLMLFLKQTVIKRRADEFYEEVQTYVKALTEAGKPVNPAYYNYTYDNALWTAKAEGPATEELFKKADKVVVIAQSHESDLKREYREFKDKFITIHNISTIDKSILDRQVSSADILKAKQKLAPHNEKLIVFIGRAEKVKAIKSVGLAFKILMERNPTDNYKVVGFGGIESGKIDKENFMKWAKIKPELGPKIEYLGWTALKPYYKMMETTGKVNAVVIMPLGSKGLLVVMEAAAMRIPVISYGVDERIVFSVLPNPKKIAEAIEFIFNPLNFKVVENKVNVSASIIKSEYNVDKYINQHLSLYQSLNIAKKFQLAA
ncbi:glycosyltransferase family 4 protein [Candidatus Woesearchaeota archaeon]|nr:glycosyltransferase family 4 protein [Candidatus Woesearchaeota archaeon]